MTEPGGAAEVAAVTGFWRELGLPGLVDIHTHFMPDCYGNAARLLGL